MNRKHGLRRCLRDTWVLVREFRNSLLLSAGLLLLGGLIPERFYSFYVGDTCSTSAR
jgi:hypothetical protein